MVDGCLPLPRILQQIGVVIMHLGVVWERLQSRPKGQTEKCVYIMQTKDHGTSCFMTHKGRSQCRYKTEHHSLSKLSLHHKFHRDMTVSVCLGFFIQVLENRFMWNLSPSIRSSPDCCLGRLNKGQHGFYKNSSRLEGQLEVCQIRNKSDQKFDT